MKTNEEYRLLEQQLAERDAQLLKNAELLGEAADALDHMEKQNVLLRDALSLLMTCKHGEFCDHYADAERKAKAALNATADLAGLVVCDAKPAGAVLVRRDTREGIMFYSTDMIPDKADIKDRFELVTVYSPKEKS
jgi:hypothetical protein